MTARDERAFFSLLADGARIARGAAPRLRAERFDVAAVLARADSLRVDGLVALALRARGVVDDVSDVERRLLEAKGRAAFFHHATAQIAKRFVAAGIAHCFVKGSIHDEMFYGGRGLRSGSDVDVLVDDLEGAVVALADIATGRPYQESRPHLPTARHLRDVPILVAGRTIIADVQGRWLFEPLLDDTAGVLARTIDARPALEDIAVYLAGDVVTDRFSGYEKLALDMASLVDRGVDWSVVISRARAARALGALWALLDLAVTHFDAPFDEALLHDIAPPLARRALLKASARGAPIAGAFTRGFETDSLFHGALHFARYVPARIVDYFVDES